MVDSQGVGSHSEGTPWRAGLQSAGERCAKAVAPGLCRNTSIGQSLSLPLHFFIIGEAHHTSICRFLTGLPRDADAAAVFRGAIVPHIRYTQCECPDLCSSAQACLWHPEYEQAFEITVFQTEALVVHAKRDSSVFCEPNTLCGIRRSERSRWAWRAGVLKVGFDGYSERKDMG